MQQLRKEEIWAPFQVLFRYLLEELRKTGKKYCIRVVGVDTEVPSTYIQKCHRLSFSENVQRSPVGVDSHVCISSRK